MDRSRWTGFPPRRNGNRSPVEHGEDAEEPPRRGDSYGEATPDCCPFDPFGGGHSELVKQSLFNITSLSPEQVSDYALNSPLGMAMKAELLSRGVNVENYLSMIEGPETL